MSHDGARDRGKTAARFAAVAQSMHTDEQFTDGLTTATLLRNETRALMRMATAALVLTCVAAAGTVMILLNPAIVQVASTRHVVSLDSSSVRVDTIDHADSQQQPGWYRVVLNTILRRTPDTESERLGLLPIGRAVYVVERRGRRVRIDSPQPGWTSIETEAGVKILEPSPDGGQRHNLTKLDKVFQRITRDAKESKVGQAAAGARKPVETLTNGRSVEKKLEAALRTSLKGTAGITFDAAGLPDALDDGRKQMEAIGEDIAQQAQKVTHDVGRSSLDTAKSGDKLYVKAKTALSTAAKERAASRDVPEKDAQEDTSAPPSSGMLKQLPE